MDGERIRLGPTELILAPRTRREPPPEDDSDVWACDIRTRSLGVARICLHNAAKRTILRHAYGDPRREVGGVMVGHLWLYKELSRELHEEVRGAEAHGRFWIEITGAVPGQLMPGDALQVTFTGETWSNIHAEIARSFPNCQIVGWYHTHPGHGVFLSRPDLRIQDDFWAQDGQLALVVDHLRGEARFFTGSTKRDGVMHESIIFRWDETLYRPEARRPEPAERAERAEVVRVVVPDESPARAAERPRDTRWRPAWRRRDLDETLVSNPSPPPGNQPEDRAAGTESASGPDVVVSHEDIEFTYPNSTYAFAGAAYPRSAHTTTRIAAGLCFLVSGAFLVYAILKITQMTILGRTIVFGVFALLLLSLSTLIVWEVMTRPHR